MWQAPSSRSLQAEESMTMKISMATTALLLVDVQMAFVERDKAGAPRSTPSAEENIARLLRKFRQEQGHVMHVHHHSQEAESAFRADKSGSKVQDFAAPFADEPVYVKHVNSAFIGTTLEADLRQRSLMQIVLCGGTANHCVETTCRMAGNYGFEVYYVSDAVWAYGGVGPDGQVHTPEEVLSMSLFNLEGEFAHTRTTAGVLTDLE